MRVFKFGGASVKDAEGIRNLGKILQMTSIDKPSMLVVSAMGKTTNALEEVVDDFYFGKGAASVKLKSIRDQHLSIAKSLQLNELLDSGVLSDTFVEAEWLIEDEIEDPYDYIYDQIVAIGELLSSRLVHAYLKSLGIKVAWIDARDIIKTDDVYRSGNINWQLTNQKVCDSLGPKLDKGEMVITAGFIGSTLENNTITLGREGSDYTGAILAAIFKADALTVWKDVPGIMTADPHRFTDAVLLPEIDYLEAIEMTFYGAKVIHPKTIKPLMDHQIPLYVKSFKKPELPGTVVKSYPDLKYPTIRVVLENQTLLQLSTLDSTFIFEDHLSAVFERATRHKIRIQMLENLALNLSLVIQAADEHIQEFKDELGNEFEIRQIDDLELFTIRHYHPNTVAEIKNGRTVYIEEYNATTAQLLVGK